MAALIRYGMMTALLGLASIAASVHAQWATVPSPAAGNSQAPAFAADQSGQTIMTWLEKTGAGHALRFARFDGNSFSAPQLIASGDDWFANWADMPGLQILPNGDWLAHWLRKSGSSTYAYDIMLVRSTDQGQSWSAPLKPHTDNTLTEHGFVSYFNLPGEHQAGDYQAGVLTGLVWLDGRNTQTSADHAGQAGAMSLRSAVINTEGGLAQEVLLDERVCDCCQTASAMTSAGPILAYRNRGVDEIRDIAILRLTVAGWSEPMIAHQDGWETAACPVNGPALAAAGNDVALAWFTMAHAMPMVNFALSTDAGQSFTRTQSFSSGTALGRVQVIRHGTGWLLSWLDREQQHGVIRLARLDARGQLSWQQQISTVAASRASGVPRIALLSEARLLLAWTTSMQGTPQVLTAVLQLPGES